MIELWLDDAPEGIGQAAARVRELGASCGFDAGRLDEVVTAVREALCNAREHGSPGSPGPPVRMTTWVQGAEVIIEIRDSGPGLQQVPPVPDLLRQIQGIEPVIGWGFYLIRCFSSELVSTTSRSAGHTLRLRFEAVSPPTPVEPDLRGENHAA